MVKRFSLSVFVLGLGLGLTLALILLLGRVTPVRGASIAVDGVIDAAYGPPAAVDSNADGHGNDVMDLVALYVAEDASNYYFAFTIDADIGATNWGKYIIYVDTTNDANGATSDAWGRSVAVSDPHKPEYSLYSWVDCVTYGPDCTQFWGWTGSEWTQSGTLDEAAHSAGATSVLEWRIAKSRLGDPGQVWVEVWGTGSGDADNAQDTINDPPEDWNAADWSSTANLACSTLFPGVKLGVDFPPDGHYFALPYLDVSGVVSPTAGVTVAVDLNGTDRYTPTLDTSGIFTQPVTLVQGDNTLTVTAESAGDTTTIVRHLSFGASQDGEVFWDGLYHDSRDPAYRNPTGAVPTGTPVTVRLRAYAGDLTAVKLRVWDDRTDTQALYAMQVDASDPAYDYWAYTLPAQDQPTALWYRFVVEDGADVDYYEDDHVVGGLYRGYNEGGPGAPRDTSADYSFQLTVYDPAFQTPDWMKNAVVYQIFPDRFRDGDPANNVVSGTHFFYGDPTAGITYTTWNTEAHNPRDVSSPFYNRWNEDFYGGDLMGIEAKLDYLQGMGVTAIYLNPIFDSPSTHKYDTTSFEKVDPHFGGDAALADLIAAADARGMEIILDGVFNHTSSDSVYFDRYSRYSSAGAYESQASPYYDWYTFSDWPDDYESWWGYDSLPVLRSENPDVRGYFYSGTHPIATRWIVSGTAGWRLDVGGDLDPGLTKEPDNTYWEGFRQAVKSTDPDAIILGEEWGDATPWILGGEWDAVMNYRFRSALLSFMRERHYEDNDNNSGSSGGVLDPIIPSQLDAWLHSIREDYPPEAWGAMLNLMGSHDTNRVRFVLSKNQKGEDTEHLPYNPATDLSPDEVDVYQKLLALLQFTLPGAPTVYYADEVGIDAPGRWANDKWEDDPHNRVPFPWDDTPGYYSQRPEVAGRYALLGQARAAHPALRTGSFDTLLTDDADMVYVYGRKWISGTLSDAAVVVVNRDDTTHTVTVDVSSYLGTGSVLTDVLDGGQSYTVTAGSLAIPDLPPMTGALLVLASGDVTPPDPPANLKAVEGPGQVTLTWDAVADAAGYHLYRSTLSGGSYARVVTATTDTIYTDTAVLNGTWYYYVATAVDAADNESAYSDEVAALPHDVIDDASLQGPPAITHTIGLTPTSPISGQVYISGVTSLAGATPGLRAQVGFGPTGTPPISWTWWTEAAYHADVGDSDQFSATLVPEHTGDFYYVYRYSTTGGRDWVYADRSGIISATGAVTPGRLRVEAGADVIPPGTPQNLRVVHWGADHITLQWDPVADVDLYAYNLYRWGQGETVSDAAYLDRVLGPTAIYTDETVLTGQTYSYTVQALDTSFNRSALADPALGQAVARLVSVTLRVQVPAFTPPDDIVYVAGDNADVFGAQWNPSHLSLAQSGALYWHVTLAAPEAVKLQYKYTRGNWDRVEKWGWLSGFANRTLTPTYGVTGVMTVNDVVHNWRDPLVTSVYPPAGAETLDRSGPVTATLSRALKPSTVDESTVQVNGGAVSGTVGVVSSTISFTPTRLLADGVDCEVRLTTGIQETDESIRLQEEYTWTFRTTPLPDLTIIKRVTPTSSVPLGSVVTYTVILSNSGKGDATGVIMTDVLPLGMNFGGWLAQGSAQRPDPSGDTVTWGPYSVPGDDAYSVRFTATVTTGVDYYGTAISNTATFSSANAGSGFDVATLALESEPVVEPRLSITKTVETGRTPAHLGDPVTYTVVVANTGSANAPGVVVTDVLPPGVVGAGLDWTGLLTAHDQVTFVLDGRVSTDTAYYGATIVNTATFSYTGGRGADGASFSVGQLYRVYLPLVVRDN